MSTWIHLLVGAHQPEIRAIPVRLPHAPSDVSIGLCSGDRNPKWVCCPAHTPPGRSAAWLARLLWEQEVPSSNLGAPT